MNIGIAITGGSGALYAKLLLKKLEVIAGQIPLQVQLVMTTNAKIVWKEELKDESFLHFQSLFQYYEPNDFYAPMASGSSGTDALIICPCSMGTVGRVAAGVSDSLITRAADVMLKEKKKLIMAVRETPYNLIHLRNMNFLAEAGAIIVPASPSFYSSPTDIESLCMTVVDRIISLIPLPNQSYQWPPK